VGVGRLSSAKTSPVHLSMSVCHLPTPTPNPPHKGEGNSKRIEICRHFFVDNRHRFDYMIANLAHEGRRREVDLTAGASAVPAGGVTNRSRAALGISRR
jgi:hypothetical protein